LKFADNFIDFHKIAIPKILKESNPLECECFQLGVVLTSYFGEAGETKMDAFLFPIPTHTGSDTRKAY